MPDYTPETWTSGQTFTPEQATAMSQEIDESETAVAGKQASDPDLAAIAALSDPNADRLLFWDDSAGAITYLTPGTGLTITGTTITSSGGSGATASHIQGVSVSTGGETRPTGSNIVLWVGGSTEPNNIGTADVWLAEGTSTSTSKAGIAFTAGEYFRLNPLDPSDPAVGALAVANQVVGNIFVAGRTASITDLAAYVTVAGSTGSVLRFGLYELNAASVTLVADFGTVASTTTGVKVKSGTAPMVIGRRYIAVCVSQGSPTTHPTLMQVSPEAMWGTQAGFSDPDGLFVTALGSRVATTQSGALAASGTIEASGDSVPCIAARCAA